MIIPKLYYNIKFWYKLKFNKPIYRVDILRAVKYNYENHRKSGICASIATIVSQCRLRFHVSCLTVIEICPKLRYNYAKNFYATDVDFRGYWWKTDDWTGDRMKFLDWLIKEYKNDKENIKTKLL